MADRILAEQAKYKTTHTENAIPDILKKPVTTKRTETITKEKAKELLDSLNIFKKIKHFIKEYYRLSEENKRLMKEMDENIAEIQRLMPAYKIEK